MRCEASPRIPKQHKIMILIRSIASTKVVHWGTYREARIIALSTLSVLSLDNGLRTYLFSRCNLITRIKEEQSNKINRTNRLCTCNAVADTYDWNLCFLPTFTCLIQSGEQRVANSFLSNRFFLDSHHRCSNPIHFPGSRRLTVVTRLSVQLSSLRCSTRSTHWRLCVR